MVSRVYTQTVGENFAGSRASSRLEDSRWLLCASCQCRDDLLLPAYFEAEILCLECRSPLRSLDFPELYCDLGEGD